MKEEVLRRIQIDEPFALPFGYSMGVEGDWAKMWMATYPEPSWEHD